METDVYVNPAGVVVSEDLCYNFHKLDLWKETGDGADKNKGVDVKSVVSLSQTTRGDPQEINPNSEVETDPWCFIGTNAAQLVYDSSEYGLRFDYEPAEASFLIQVPRAGLYRAWSEHMEWLSGANVKLYLAPEGAQDPTADAYYLGCADTYAPSRITQAQVPLKIRALDAGRYRLTYRMEGKNPALTGAGRAGLGAFHLKGADSESTIVGSVDGPDTLAVGSSADFALQIDESDGLNRWKSPFEVRVDASEAGIVDTEVVYSADRTENCIRVTGTGAGFTILHVTVSMKGMEKAFDVPVTVFGAEATADRDYKYLFLKSLPIGTKISTVDSFDKTMAGSPAELRPGGGTDPWRFEFQNCSDFYNVNDVYGAVLGVKAGASAGIRIRLPKSGLFRPEIPFYSGTACDLVRMYIAPADAEEPMAEEYSVGAADTYATSSKTVIARFRTRWMDAGDYIVSWKLEGQRKNLSATNRLWFNGVILRLVDAYPEMSITPAQAPTIKLGNSALVALNAAVEDGAPEDFYGAQFRVASEVENAVTAKAVKNGQGAMCMEITGLKLCQTDVAVTVLLNGAERASFTIPVTVCAPGKLARVEPELAGNSTATIVLRDQQEGPQRLSLRMIDEDGDEISPLSMQLQNGICTFESDHEEIAAVDDNGAVTPIAPGQAVLRATVTLAGVTKNRTNYGDRHRGQNQGLLFHRQPSSQRPGKRRAIQLGTRHAQHRGQECGAVCGHGGDPVECGDHPGAAAQLLRGLPERPQRRLLPLSGLQRQHCRGVRRPVRLADRPADKPLEGPVPGVPEEVPVQRF